MHELTPRQKEILTRTIESHIETFHPVGSRTLTERYAMHLSPALVRQEMGTLEELGYLNHPHTSAGRVPTDKGYHFYVDEGIEQESVPTPVLRVISQAMEEGARDFETLMERASHVLSTISQEAALMMAPPLQQLYLKEISLVPLSGSRVLAVWCSTSGLVRNCVVKMGEPILAEEAERISNFVNKELAGVPIHTLEEALSKRAERHRDSFRRLYERTLEIVRASAPHQEMPRLFVEGSRYVLRQPEFRDLEKFRLFVSTVEEKSRLVDLLSQQPQEEGIHIAIGEGGLSKEMWDCSLVSSPYLWERKYVGTVAVLGPRRMPYGRIMGLVSRMAQELTQVLARWES